jgi:anti-sigma factor RsiW
MNHEHFQELINLYIDTGLNDAASAEMFAHLSVCNDCRNLMHSSMQVQSFYQDDELEEVPDSLNQRVFTSARNMQTSMKHQNRPAWLWRTRLLIPLPAAASIAILILIGSLLLLPLFFQETKQSSDNLIEITSKMPPELQQQFKYFEEFSNAGKIYNHN